MDVIRQQTIRKRSFSINLQDYCFAGSFAAGLDEFGEDSDQAEHGEGSRQRSPSPDVRFAAEYGALRPRDNHKLEVTSGAASPITVAPGLRVEGSSSFIVSAANLTKSLVGIGMLALPRALADGGPLLGTSALLACGTAQAFSFFMLGYCAHLTGSATLPQLWDATVGPRTSAVVEVVIATDTLLSCTAFALLIGDYTSKSIGGLFPELPAHMCSHSTLVMVVGVSILLPLCLVQRLSLLRFSSIAGLICTLYVFLYVVSDFGYQALSGEGLAQAFPAAGRARPGGLLRSTAIFAVAFMAHFNAPAFYADLKHRSPSRFAGVCAVAYGAAFLIYLAFGLSGLGRFGARVPGNALAAYGLSTPVLLMWLGMGLCVTASFPLVFGALRGAALRLAGRACGWEIDHASAFGRAVATFMVLGILCAGASIRDLSAVVSLCGSLSGFFLGLIFPGLIMLGMKKRKTARFTAVAHSLVVLGGALAASASALVLGQDALGL